ncbi:MAG: hypothetical protein FWF38_01410 [Spirochaetaceae bacterium]|nr:hypothetical protein [Spirochaetaceae bacterium]
MKHTVKVIGKFTKHLPRMALGNKRKSFLKSAGYGFAYPVWLLGTNVNLFLNLRGMASPTPYGS